MKWLRSSLCTAAIIGITLSVWQASGDASGNPQLTSARHALWVIESDTNRTYLLGSVHVLRDTDYPLPEVFYQAYEDAERIVMELDFNAIDPVTTYAKTREAAMLPAGTTLKDIVGKKNYRKALKRASASEINLSMFERVEPWFAAMTISQVQLQRLGFSAEKGIEQHFLQKARQDNKPGIGLETMEQQFGFLDNLSVQAQTKLLMDALTTEAELLAEGDNMMGAWKTGNADQLNAFFADDFENNPELREVLLLQRNHRWLPKIIGFTQSSDDYLVIVGALHLVGPNGVLQMMRDQGFNVQQL